MNNTTTAINYKWPTKNQWIVFTSIAVSSRTVREIYHEDLSLFTYNIQLTDPLSIDRLIP